ncbi:MAG: hypothetical protein HDQ88_04385 [Clostridia bacterium]|nr:hypothetical protein [Clostridia bacterium]
MAKFETAESMKGLRLVAVTSSRQATHNDKGDVTGNYIDVQVDQTHLTQDDIRKGKALVNPSIETHKTKKGKFSHSVWYGLDQMKHFEDVAPWTVAYGAHADGSVSAFHYLPFVGNIYPRDMKDGSRKFVVLCPRDPGSVPDDQRRKVIEYNERNQILKSDRGVGERADRVAWAHRQQEIPLIVKAWRSGSMGKDQMEDAVFNIDPLFVDVDISPEESQSEESYMARRRDMTEALCRMHDRDGRLYPIDYTLMNDDAAWERAKSEHDGIMVVERTGDECTVTCIHGMHEADEIRATLDSGRVAGQEFVWFDSKERQLDQELNHPDKMPAVEYETWQEHMDLWVKDVQFNISPPEVSVPPVSRREEKPVKDHDSQVDVEVDDEYAKRADARGKDDSTNVSYDDPADDGKSDDGNGPDSATKSTASFKDLSRRIDDLVRTDIARVHGKGPDPSKGFGTTLSKGYAYSGNGGPSMDDSFGYN